MRSTDEGPYAKLLPTDGKLLPCVFKEDVGGTLSFRKRYKKYVCSACGRLDAGKALDSSGLDPEFAANTGKRHLCNTYDYLCVVNSELRRLLEAHCDDVRYFNVQNKGDHFVIWPKHLVIPDGSSTYERTLKCRTCGFYRSIVFGPGLMHSIPDIAIGAVLLEAPQGPNPAWFVNEELAKALKSAKIKGILLLKR